MRLPTDQSANSAPAISGRRIRFSFGGLKNPLSRVVVVASAALVVVGLGLYALNLSFLYRDAIANAEASTRNLARAFAEHTARTFEAVDRALQAAVALHDERLIRSDNSLRAHDVLREIQGQSDILLSLALNDVHGNLIASSRYAKPPPFNVADRDYFQVHAEPFDAGLFISAPFRTQLSDIWVSAVSRRLSQPDGGFAGTAVGLIDLSYFKRFHDSIEIGKTQTIGLLRRDATIILREPPSDVTAEGNALNHSPLFERYLPVAPDGTFTTVSQLDHIERIFSYATVRGYPLIVTISLARDEALAGWWRQFLFTSATFLAFAALYLFIAYHLLQQLERDEERRHAADLARREAVEASKAKSAFLSHMSHELRTPLNAILGFAEIIRDRLAGAASEEAYRSYAAQIHRAGSHLLSLINDVLDLAKIEASRRQLEESEIDLRRVVKAAVEQHLPIAERAGVAILLDLPDDLPRLAADARAVTQMLHNLLSNAIKFTPQGGRVEIIAAVAGNEMTLTVRDTGVGIAPEDQTQLFQDFAHSANPLVSAPQGGTGLGLAIVKGLIELHGGWVELSSVRGQGTTITLHFPGERIATARVAA